MNQKEKIISLLQVNGIMTQGELVRVQHIGKWRSSTHR